MAKNVSPRSRASRSKIARRATGEAGESMPAVSTAGGHALTDSIRQQMETAFGHDFSHVRVHTDAAAGRAADHLSAQAFAMGADLFFAPAKFSPDSVEGKRLLLHELTHVVQSDEGRLPSGGVSDPNDRHESEAYANESRLEARLTDPAVAVQQSVERHAAPASGLSRSENEASAPSSLVRGDIVRLANGATGVVVGTPLLGVGDLEVLVLGELFPRHVPAEALRIHEGLEATGGAVAQGSVAYGLQGGDWVQVLVVRISEEEVATPIGPVVRRRAEALPLDGPTRANVDGAVRVVASDPGVGAVPTYAPGQDVYAKRDAEQWRRGQVASAERPWGEGAVVADGAEGGLDGWVYTIYLEFADSTEERIYESDQLHFAEPLTVPGPTLKAEPPASDQPDSPVDESVQEPGLDGAAAQEGGPAVAPAVAPAPPAAPDAPVTTPAATTITPAVAAVMTAPAVPALSLAPARVAEPTLEPGEGDYIEGQTGIPVHDNLLQVQSSLDQLVSTTSLGLQLSIDAATTTATDATAVIAQANTSFDATAQAQQANLQTVATTNAANANTAVATAQTAVDTVNTTAVATVAQVSTTATTTLDARATQIQQTVTANIDRYATSFDSALEAKKNELRTRLLGVISVIATEATTVESACKAEARTGGAGNAAERADEIAGRLCEVSVKKKYVAVMRTLCDQTLARIDELKGNPMRVIAGDLTAPTLANLFPASRHYADQLAANTQAAEQRTQQNTQRFRDVTTRQAQTQTATTNQVATTSAQTLSTAQTALDHTTQALAADNQAQNQSIAADSATASQQTVDQLNQTVAQNPGQQPPSPMWAQYVATYTAQEAAHQAQIQAALQQGSADRASRTQSAADEVRQSLDQHATNTAAQIQADNDQFGRLVAADAQAVAADTAATTTALTTTGADVATRAATAQDDEVAALDTDAQTFIDSTVNTMMATYTTGVDATFTELAGQMQKDLEGAADKGKEKERADRRTRADGCYRAAEHTWGTDEELYMKSVSGITAVQGYALQAEYVTQYGEGLRWRIDDETSGALCTSLLAWTVGDEVAAVSAAMDYAANSYWGPDIATTEAALRGLSDEGRTQLQGNATFQQNRQRMLLRTTTDRWLPDQNDTDALSTLSDMSQTQEQAVLMADAIRLEDCFNRAGTDEAGAFTLLGTRDAAGNQQLAEAYAKYTYERRNLGKKWADLTPAERQRLTGTSLADDMQSDMSGDDLTRGNALLVGNRGLARAAQLQDSADYLNDADGALAALDNPNLRGGDTWMDRVAADQEQANFLAGMQRDTDEGLNMGQVRAMSSAARQAENIQNYDQNQTAVSGYLTREFGDSSTAARGNEDTDVIIHRMLQQKLQTGEANAEDLFAYGADTTGTREQYVTQALQQIKGVADINDRLARLEALGSYASDFISRHRGPDMLQAQQNGQGGMSRLPSYLSGQLRQAHPGLSAAIRNILIVLDYESDGGEQFDFELLLAEATARDNNVTDTWETARLRFLSMLDASDLDKYRDDPEVLAFQRQNVTQIVSDETRSARGEGEDQLHRGIGDEHEKLLAAHTLNCERVYNEGKGVYFDNEGWLKTEADGRPSAATQEWYRKFQEMVGRVERAATALNAANQSLLTIVATIVSVIAGIAITIVSLGAASAAAAGMIAAAITLGAGIINVTAKYMVLGDRYGNEEMLGDIANILADAVLQVATLGAGKMAGITKFMDEWVQAGGGTLFRLLVGEAVKTVPGELRTILMSEDFWRGERIDALFLDALLNVAKGTLSGVASNKLGVATGLSTAESQLGKGLQNALDNVLSTVTDPANWNDDMGWTMLRSLGEAALASAIGSKVLPAMANRLNAKSALSDADWQHISELPSDVRAQMFGRLSPNHAAELRARAAQGSALHADLAAQLPAAPVTPPAPAPAPTTPGSPDVAPPVVQPPRPENDGTNRPPDPDQQPPVVDPTHPPVGQAEVDRLRTVGVGGDAPRQQEGVTLRMPGQEDAHVPFTRYDDAVAIRDAHRAGESLADTARRLGVDPTGWSSTPVGTSTHAEPTLDGPDGNAATIPDTTFRGDARPGGVDRNAVTQRVAEALPSVAGDGVTVSAQGHTGTITVDGQPPKVFRVEVATAVNDGAVASYRIVGDEIVITLAAGTLDHHVERALAHEIAEIKTVLRTRTPDAAQPDALARGATSGDTPLSPHDQGRLAEVGVLLRQMENPPHGTTREQLADELNHLLTHLGIGTGGSDAQIALVRNQLGADSPVVRGIDAHLEGAGSTTVREQRVRSELDRMVADGEISAEQARRIRGEAPFTAADLPEQERRLSIQKDNAGRLARQADADRAYTQGVQDQAIARHYDEQMRSADPTIAAQGRAGWDRLPEAVRVSFDRDATPVVHERGSLGSGFSGTAAAVSSGGDLAVGLPAPVRNAPGRLGQGAGDSEVPGGAKQMGDTAPGSPHTDSAEQDHFMLARDHAENIDLNRERAGIQQFGMEASGAVEPRPENATGWPAGARVRVPFEVTDPRNPTGPKIKHYEYFASLDIAVGAGQALQVPGLSGAENARTAGWDFGPDAIHPGANVGVIGGGPSAAWASEQSSGPAGSVTWMGRRPEVSAANLPIIQDTATRAQRQTELQTAVANAPSEFERFHAQRALTTFETDVRVFTLRQQMNDTNLDQGTRDMASQQLDDLTFAGAALPRNLAPGAALNPTMQQENGGKIQRIAYDQADVVSMTARADGKIEIRLRNRPDPLVFDQSVTAIGQNSNAPGGAGPMLEQFRGRMVPIWGPHDSALGFTPILGLRDPASGVRLLGAATNGQHINLLLAPGARNPDTGRPVSAAAVHANLDFQASRLDTDSRGVRGGYAHTEDMIAGANSPTAR